MPRSGLAFLSEALQIRFSANSRVYRTAAGLCFPSFAIAGAVGSTVQAPSLPSTSGALAPCGAAILAPGLGATDICVMNCVTPSITRCPARSLRT
jgi:hypothetical protein